MSKLLTKTNFENYRTFMSLILFTIQYSQDLIEQLPIIKQPIFYSKYIPLSLRKKSFWVSVIGD
ncbi:hypothetical protein ACR1PN_02235 [Chryseobacterium sp. RLHN22]